MFSKMIKEWIIIFVLTVIIPHVIGIKTSEWVSDLMKYVKKESQQYQVLLLTNATENSPRHETEDIIRKISTEHPTLKMDIQEATVKKALEMSMIPPFYEPQATTLIVVIQLLEDNLQLAQFVRLRNFMTFLSEVKPRPQCLIILPEETRRLSCMKLLRLWWSKRFVDTTILELRSNKIREDNFFLDTDHREAILHQFNPFTSTVKKSGYSSKVSWFPDKTRNLHGYQMKAGMLDFPPSMFLGENQKKTMTEPTGSDVMLTKALAKAMNFQILWVTSNEKYLGTPSCIKEKNSGFIRNLMDNDIQMIGIESDRHGSCIERLLLYSKGTQISHMNVLVPIFPEESQSLSVSWKIWNAVALISLFFLTWVFSRILNFENHNWSLLYLVLVVFGLTSPREPQRLAERIVFGSILLTCVLHSSVIYSAFTDVKLQTRSPVQFDTLQDVAASSILPSIDDIYFFLMYNNSEGSSRSLLDRSIRVSTYNDCINHLIQEKNVSCIIQSNVADWVNQKTRDSCGQPVMKIVEQHFSSTVSGFNLETGSPYLKRFDVLILRLVQSGLPYKWQKMPFGNSNVIEAQGSCSNRESNTLHMRKQLVFIIGFGYLLAFLVFVIEVSWSYLNKQRHPTMYPTNRNVRSYFRR